MDAILRDLRHSLRRLRKSPGFTVIAVLSLALGIGANVVIFSLVNAILLRDTPVHRPDELVELSLTSSDMDYTPFSYPEYGALVEATDEVFADVSGSMFGVVPHDRGDRVESVMIEMVTGSYFPLLGLTPALGRLLSDEDHVSPGAHAVVVLSNDYWRSGFGADPNVVGREIRLSGRPYTVVGVAPEDYEGNVRGLTPSMYLPVYMINRLQPTPYDQLEAPGNHSLFVTARVAPGVSMPRVRTVISSYVEDMRREYPVNWGGQRDVGITPVSEIFVNPMLDGVIVPAAGLMLVIVALVLLIACSNLASFLLARARDRRREIAVRLALGAGRGRLIRQSLTDSTALALIGGALGVLLARGLTYILETADLPVPIPITLDLGLDPAVLVFALAVSVLAGVMFGLAPAVRSTNPNIVGAIKSENTGGGPRRRVTLRSALVSGQVAMSLLLLVTAGLFLRSLRARQAVDPGFGQDPSAIVTFAVPADRYTEPEARQLVRRLEERVASMPGVQAVGSISNLHLNPLSNNSTAIDVDGMEPPEGEAAFTVSHASVDTGFFDAAGIPILQGRNFLPTDGPDAAPVAIVNRAMADRFWPGENPIGRTFRRDDRQVRVVGVTATAKIRSLGEAPRPFIYWPYSQEYNTLYWMVAKTRGDAASLGPDILAETRAMAPDLMVLWTKTMDRHLAAIVLPARLGAIAIAAFAALALILALLGVYGVVGYAVARRSREVGIRLSLGAAPGAIVRLLTGTGVRLVAVGAAVGLVLAVLTARVLSTFLYGIRPIDPVTFVAVPLLLLGVGLLAAFVPARRATRVDPVRVLKAE